MPRPVREVLPHRDPFLFVDEILDLTETTVLARRTVRAEEPQFLGHYPGHPIMPGVLLCEMVLQAGCYLMAHRLSGADRLNMADRTREGGGVSEGSTLPVVTRMNRVKFRQIVRPGDVLDIRAEYERSMLGAHMMKGAIVMKKKTVLSLDFACMLAQGTEEPR